MEGHAGGVAGLRLPLANVMVGGVVSTESLGATAGVAGAGGMEGHAGGVAGLRLPLAQAVVAGQALHTPVGVAGSTVGMVGSSGAPVSTVSGLSSHAGSNSKSHNQFRSLL